MESVFFKPQSANLRRWMRSNLGFVLRIAPWDSSPLNSPPYGDLFFFAFSKRPLKQIQETDRFKANPFQGGKGRIFEVYTCVFVEYPAAKSQISFINSEHKGWMISIKQQWQEWVRSLKLTASLHLKTDGWKMNFLSGWGLFSGATC